MKRKGYSYYITVVFVLALISIPLIFSGKTRCLIVKGLKPAWSSLYQGHYYFSRGASWLFKSRNERLSEFYEKNQYLLLENEMLKEKLSNIQQLLDDEQFIQYQISRLEILGEGVDQKIDKRYSDLKNLLSFQLAALPARVIYRDPASWSSSLWVDIGSHSNLSEDSVVISKDSPVICGTTLIGIVDYVGEYCSRVRLITDSGLNPAVRVARGSPQQDRVCEQIEALLYSLDRDESGLDNNEKILLTELLDHWRSSLMINGGGRYLAKGFLQGGSRPLWRSTSQSLKGIGFNYDYSDKEGPARDLRSGRPLDDLQNGDSVSLIKEGDLLVTTGLDGVFPAGLRVAEVSRVYPLQEGSYSYEIEATPSILGFNEIDYVYIMPSRKLVDQKL